jgi:FKBP-type peptidyl-prolyl cis-trans isomerase
LLAACEDQGVMREIERAEAEQAQGQKKPAQRCRTFLAETRAQPGIEARPSGLLIERSRAQGRNQSLPRPTINATVLVHYEGKLADGSVFDSSFQRGEPRNFRCKRLCPASPKRSRTMRPGDEIVATFPMELGYGPKGARP